MSEVFLQAHRIELNRWIERYLQEDIGNGDITSQFCIDSEIQSVAQIIVRQKCIVAGVSLAKLIIKYYDSRIAMSTYHRDGEEVNSNDVFLELSGPAISVLSIERLLLNCIGRMSAIATQTKKIVDKIKGTECQILDTRKTTPGFRLAEKWAVKIGGGQNHRMGLYDVILIKDNHIDFASGIHNALERVENKLNDSPNNIFVIVEARNLKEVEAILKFRCVNRILLDNFSPNLIEKSVKLIGKSVQIEVSGNIKEDNVLDFVIPGVDYISIGSITHSVPIIDLSLSRKL